MIDTITYSLDITKGMEFLAMQEVRMGTEYEESIIKKIVI